MRQITFRINFYNDPFFEEEHCRFASNKNRNCWILWNFLQYGVVFFAWKLRYSDMYIGSEAPLIPIWVVLSLLLLLTLLYNKFPFFFVLFFPRVNSKNIPYIHIFNIHAKDCCDLLDGVVQMLSRFSIYQLRHIAKFKRSNFRFSFRKLWEKNSWVI